MSIIFFLITFTSRRLFIRDAMMDYQPEMMMPNRYDIAILLLRKPWLDERLTTEFAMFYDFSYMSEKKVGFG